MVVCCLLLFVISCCLSVSVVVVCQLSLSMFVWCRCLSFSVVCRLSLFVVCCLSFVVVCRLSLFVICRCLLLLVLCLVYEGLSKIAIQRHLASVSQNKQERKYFRCSWFSTEPAVHLRMVHLIQNFGSMPNIGIA